MADIQTIKGSFCSSYYGDIFDERDVIVDIKTASFPVPEGFEVEEGMECTVGVKLGTITITMAVTHDEDNFYIEGSDDRTWLNHYATKKNNK